MIHGFNVTHACLFHIRDTSELQILLKPSQEPEVTDLAEFLVASGARIKGIGARRLVITGRKRMNGAEFTLIPDRIEAGTFMVAAAITRSSISLSPIIPCHLTSVTDRLLAIGCKVTRKRPHILEVCYFIEFCGSYVCVCEGYKFSRFRRCQLFVMSYKVPASRLHHILGFLQIFSPSLLHYLQPAVDLL